MISLKIKYNIYLFFIWYPIQRKIKKKKTHPIK